MTSARDRVVELIETSVTRLDRTLRSEAIRTLASRATVITDGRADDATILVVALVREAASAAESAIALEPGSGSLQEVESGAARPAAARSEQAASERADRVDLALVALRSARRLVSEELSEGEHRLDGDRLLETALALTAPGHHRLVREAALHLIAEVLAGLPSTDRGLVCGLETFRDMRRYAHGAGAARFVQCAAIDVLVQLSGEEMASDFARILREATGPDSMIVRHHVVQRIPDSAVKPGRQVQLLRARRNDPSQHVRQGAVRALCRLGRAHAPAFDGLRSFLRGESADPVIGVALLELASAVCDGCQPAASETFGRLLRKACRSGRPVLQRASLAAVRRVVSGPPGATALEPIVVELAELIAHAELDMAELASALVRELGVRRRSVTRELHARIVAALRRTKEGESVRVALPSGVSDADVEATAFVASLADLPVQFERTTPQQVNLVRGEPRKFRIWRLAYELSHWGPDKRQSHLHTHARLPLTSASTVPLRQAEITPTRVPGERRALLGASWGCFLPRVDDLLAACRRRRGKRLVTPFGTLVVEAPRGALARLWLRLYLSLHYARLCELRDRSLTAEGNAGKRGFTSELRRLGFELTYGDSSVLLGRTRVSIFPAAAERFFSAVPLPVALWLEDALQYVVSPSGNTAWHLALVVWLLLTVMIVRASRVQRRFAHARRRLPLSIGGWGSRGKSGTERLKTALFHACHLDVVSKTTGCEAMLVLARRDQVARELFLYRPYDKATIWEQETAVEYAQRLGAQVFLWECMALQPEFVDILNREWMRDPITTITNAYPDHEDVMGPSGEDVARVIGRFVPAGGTVLSSEDQMQALIRDSALARGSQLVEIDELAADLLPHDLLERFPYQEHPRNIALVLRLAEHLELDPVRALVDVADHVVPDLGVLKTFPRLRYRQRSLRFSNGMSANERAGFLSNWNRLSFASHDPDQAPETLLLAVVNNRADRVPRSRVFAELFARDVTVDRLIVIGTNGAGMRGFLREAAQRQVERLTGPGAAEDASQWLRAVFTRLGTPLHLKSVQRRAELYCRALTKEHQTEEVAEHLRQAFEEARQLAGTPDAALDGLSEAIDAAWEPLVAVLTDAASGDVLMPSSEARKEVSTTLRWLVRGWVTRERLLSRLAAQAGAPDSEWLGGVRRCFLSLFEEKIVVLEDSDANGDEVIHSVFRAIPPGLHAEVMGCQNIKGTGLDFVYRFMEIQTLNDWLQRLEREPSERGSVLTQMRDHGGYGLFACHFTMERMRELLREQPAQWGPHAQQVSELLAQLEAQALRLVARMGRGASKSRWQRALGRIEPFVDHLDGIRRRKGARAIMHELTEGRLDTATAAERLRAVVARQKGGWLAKDLSRLLQSRAASPPQLAGSGGSSAPSRKPRAALRKRRA